MWNSSTHEPGESWLYPLRQNMPVPGARISLSSSRRTRAAGSVGTTHCNAGIMFLFCSQRVSMCILGHETHCIGLKTHHRGHGIELRCFFFWKVYLMDGSVRSPPQATSESDFNMSPPKHDMEGVRSRNPTNISMH